MDAQLTWSPDSPWLSIQFLQGRKQFLKKEKLSAEEGTDAPESERCVQWFWYWQLPEALHNGPIGRRHLEGPWHCWRAGQPIVQPELPAEPSLPLRPTQREQPVGYSVPGFKEHIIYGICCLCTHILIFLNKIGKCVFPENIQYCWNGNIKKIQSFIIFQIMPKHLT